MNFQFLITYVFVVLMLSTTGLFAQDKSNSMPNPDKMSTEEYGKAKEAWIENNPEDYNKIVDEMKANYVNPVDFLPWEDVDPIPGQNIFSIKQLAPNIPTFTPLPNAKEAITKYNDGKEEWKKDYPIEFVKFNNFMLQVVGSDKLPRFMSYPVTEREPLIGNAETMDKAQMVYELRLMNWTYTYNNSSFMKIYETEVTVPKRFNLEKHKIEMTSIVPDEYDRKMFFEGEEGDVDLLQPVKEAQPGQNGYPVQLDDN